MLQSIWKTPFSFYGFLMILRKKVFLDRNIEENTRAVTHSTVPLCLKYTETGLCTEFLLLFWVGKWRKKNLLTVFTETNPYWG